MDDDGDGRHHHHQHPPPPVMAEVKWHVLVCVCGCQHPQTVLRDPCISLSMFWHVFPSIPRETSCHLRHLLLALLQRSHKDRLDFGTLAVTLPLPPLGVSRVRVPQL